MGSTAIGREASRVSTCGDGRAGPDREHARREPFSGGAFRVTGLTVGCGIRRLRRMSDPISQELFARACKVIPGGVNSPVRAFRAVGGEPIFIKEAHGPMMVGADGTEYVDYVGSWGPMILGHAQPDVVAAIPKRVRVTAPRPRPRSLWPSDFGTRSPRWRCPGWFRVAPRPLWARCGPPAVSRGATSS